MYPVCLPHELLGYDRGDIGGILLSFKIASKISKEESSASTPRGKQQARRNKWKANKGGSARQ